MFKDVINKQVFEITCKTETTARRVQQHIESHTAIQFSNIMDAVFSEAGIKNNYLQIGKIEIDLGDIWIDELGNMETASRFKKILQQKIEDTQNNRTDDGGTITGGNGSPKLTAEIKSELELIRVFITTGDLPWWINKSNSFSIDAIVNKLLLHHPEMFKRLVAENLNRPALLSRLSAQISQASYSMIAELIPGFSKLTETTAEFSEASLKKRLTEETMQMKPPDLSTHHRKKLRKMLQEHGQKSFENRSELLAELLIKLDDHLFVNKLPVEGTALGNLLIQFGITGLILQEKNIHFTNRRSKLQQAKNTISQLTVFEVELLAFGLSTCFDAANNFIFPNALTIETGPHSLNTEGKVSGILNINAGIVNETINEIAPINKLEENQFTSEKAIELKKNIPTLKTELTSGQVEPDNDESLKTEIPVNPTKEMSLLENDLDTGHNGLASDEPNEIKIDNLVPHLGKTIIFILKKLERHDKALIEYLQALNKTQLQHLATIFKKRNIETKEYKKMINQLLNYPEFIKYNVLKVYSSLVFAKELPTANKFSKPVKNVNKAAQKPGYNITQKLSPPYLLSVINDLPARDLFVLKDVLSKKRFDTEGEKRLFKKILLQLSQQDILLLKYLTELPPPELEKMQPAVLSYGETTDLISEPYFNQNEEQTIQIENAGLCLLAVYLPGFFKQLGWLENGKFKKIIYAVRAVYLLQYIAGGNSKRPEYLLQFNKLLCSLEPREVIINNIRLTRKEKKEADILLASVIQNWRALKNTSVKGFRASFLQRKGILSETSNGWVLRVEKKGFDILLDAIPWSFNLVKLSWMKKIVQVEW